MGKVLIFFTGSKFKRWEKLDSKIKKNYYLFVFGVG